MKESLVRRVLVTIGALLFLEVGRRIWLPIVNPSAATEVFSRLGNSFDRNDGVGGLGAFALGISPAVTAFIVVELAALVWPRWRPLRHDPHGRVSLGRAVVVLSVIISLVQAWALVRSIEGMDGIESVLATSGRMTYAIGIPTLVAGSLVTFITAAAVSRHGLVDGFVLFIGWDGARELTRELARGEADHTGLIRSAAVVVTGVVLVALTTPQPSAKREKGATPYRGSRPTIDCAPWIPTPASSVAPVVIAWNAVGFGAALGMKTPERWSVQRSSWALPAFVVALALTAALTFALNRPRAIAETAARLGISKRSSGRKASEREVRRALPATLATIAALFAAGQVAVHHVIGAAVAIAAAIEIVRAVRQHATQNLECVLQERRPHVVPQLVAVLASVGIAARVRGTTVLALFRIFGAYACAELWVDSVDAKLARGWLAHWLSSTAAPKEKRARLPLEKASKPRLIARAGAIGIGAVALGVMAHEYRKPPENPYASEPRATFVVVRVRDDVDPLADVREEQLPTSVAIYTEDAPTGLGHLTEVHFARIAVAGEPADETKLFGDWLATIPVPPESRLVLQEVSDTNENGAYAVVALRSFLLDAHPIVTEVDVTEARVAYEPETGAPYVAITLGQNGARRFADATEESIERRIAIVVDGKIDVVPVVRSRIDGGRLQISMGAELAPGRALEEARRLAGRLAPR